LSVTDDVDLRKSVLIGEHLSVSAGAYFSNQVFVREKLSVGKEALFRSNVQIIGQLSVLEAALFRSDVMVGQKLSVTDDVDLRKSALIGEQLSVSAGAYFSNQVFVREKLSVGKEALFRSNVQVIGQLSVLDDVSLRSHLVVGRTLSVQEDALFRSDVMVATKLSVQHDADLRRDVLIGQHLSVSADAHFSNQVFVRERLSVGKEALFRSNVQIIGQLSVLEDVSFRSDLLVGQKLSVTDDVDLRKSALIGEHLSVSADAYFSNQVFVREKLSVGKEALFRSNVQVIGKLSVLDDVSLRSRLMVGRTLSVQEDALFRSDVMVGTKLSVQHDADLRRDVLIGEHLSVSADAYFSNQVFVREKLSVGAEGHFESDVKVVGELSLQNNLFVGQGLSINSSAYFADELVVSKRLSIGEEAMFKSNILIRGPLSVQDDVFLRSNLFLDKQLSVRDDVHIRSNVFVAERLSVNADSYLTQLFVTQDASFDTSVLVGDHISVSKNLYIEGDLIVQSNYHAINIFTDEQVKLTERLIVSNDGTGPALKVIQTGDNPLMELWDESRRHAVWTNEGYLGLGTVSPNTYRLHVNDGQVLFEEDLYIGNELSVNMQAYFANDVYLSSALSVESDVFLNSGMEVAGKLSVQDDTVLNNTLIRTDLSVIGNTKIQGHLSVNKLFMAEGELDILPADMRLSNLVLTSNLSLGKDLWIDGNGTIEGYLSVGRLFMSEGELDILPADMRLSNLILTSNLSLGEHLFVEGNAMVQGYLSVSTLYMGEGELDLIPTDMTLSNLYLSSNLSLGEDLYIEGNAMVQGYLSVNTLYMGEGELDLNLPDEGYMSNMFLTSNLSVGQHVYVTGNISANYIYTEMLHAAGQMLDQENWGIEGDLVVGGSITTPIIQGLIDVGYLLVDRDDLRVENNLSIGQNLYLDNNLLVSNSISINKFLYLESNVYLKSTLSLAKEVYFSSNVLLEGVLSVKDFIYLSSGLYAKDVFVEERLSVAKELYLESNVFLGESLSVGAESFFTNKLYLEEALSVKGKVYLESNVYVDGPLSLSDALYLEGDAYFNADVFARERLSVKKEVYFGSNLIVQGNLDVTGTNLVANDAHIKGSLSLLNPLWAENNVIVRGHLSIHDELFLENNLKTDGSTLLNGELSVRDAVFLNSTLSVGEMVYLSRSLSINSNVYLAEDLFVDGDIWVEEDLRVSSGLIVEGNMIFRSNQYDVVQFTDEGTLLNRTIVSNDMEGPALTVRQNKPLESLMEVWSGDHRKLQITADGSLGIGTTPVGSVLHVGSGNTKFEDRVYTLNDLHAEKDLIVSSELIVGGEVSVRKEVYMSSNLVVDGRLSLGGDLQISSDTTMGSLLSVFGDAYLEESLIVKGSLSVHEMGYLNNADVADTLTTSKGVMRSTLSIRGAAYFMSNVYLDESMSVNRSIFVDEQVQVQGHLSMGGDAYFAQNIVVGSEKVLLQTSGVTTTGSLVVRNENASAAVTLEQTRPAHPVLSLRTADGIEEFRITEEGYVGMGRTNPLARVHVTRGDVILDSNLLVQNNITVKNDLSVLNDIVLGGSLSIGGTEVFMQGLLSVNQLFATELIAETTTIINEDANLTVTGNVRAGDSIYAQNLISCATIHVDNAVQLHSTLNLSAGQYISDTETLLNSMTVGDSLASDVDLDRVILRTYGSIEAHNLHSEHLFTNDVTVTGSMIAETDLNVEGSLRAAQIEQSFTVDGLAPISDPNVSFSNAFDSFIGKTGVFMDDLYVLSNLSVAGACRVDELMSTPILNATEANVDNLNVSGTLATTTLELSADLLLSRQLSVASAVFVQGDLSVAGTVYPSVLYQPITADAESYAEVNAGTQNQLEQMMLGSLKVDRAARVRETLYVDGETLFVGTLSMNSEVYVRSNVYLSGLNVSEEGVFERTLRVIEDALLQSNLSIAEDLTVKGAARVTESLSVQGAAYFLGDLRTMGWLSVGAESHFEEAVVMKSTLSIGGAVFNEGTNFLGGELSVGSKATFREEILGSGTLSLAQSAYLENVAMRSLSLRDTLFASSNIEIAEGLSVGGRAVFGESVEASLCMAGLLSVQSLFVFDTLSVKPDSYFQSNVRVEESLFASNIYSSNDIAVRNQIRATSLSLSESAFLNELEVSGDGYIGGVLSVNQLFLRDSDLQTTLPDDATFSNLVVVETALVEGYLSLPMLYADTIHRPIPSTVAYSNLVVKRELIVDEDLTVRGELFADSFNCEGLYLSNGELSVNVLHVEGFDIGDPQTELPANPQFSNLLVDSNVFVGGMLSVGTIYAGEFDFGTANFTGDIGFDTLTLEDTLSVGGDVCLAGFVSASSSMQLGGVSIEESSGQVKLTASSISVSTALHIGPESLTYTGDVLEISGDTRVNGTLDVHGDILNYGLTLSNYEIARQSFSNALTHRLSRGFQQVFGRLQTGLELEDIAVGVDIGVRSNWWNHGNFVSIRDTVRDMSVLPINSEGEIDLGILESLAGEIPTSFDFDANLNVSMQDEYGDDHGQMYGVMLHGNQPQSANDFIRINMLNPNNIAFKNKFKADFDFNNLSPEWRVIQNSVVLPDETLHTQGTVLFNVLFGMYHAPNVFHHAGDITSTSKTFLVPSDSSKRLTHYYELAVDRSSYIYREGTELYPRWTYRKWRNDMSGDIYFTKYKSAFGWGDPPNTGEVYNKMLADGTLLELYRRTCEYIATGDAGGSTIAASDIQTYFDNYLIPTTSNAIVLGSNMSLTNLKHNILNVTLNQEVLPNELSGLALPVIDWTQSVNGTTLRYDVRLNTSQTSSILYPIRTAILKIYFWSHQLSINEVTKFFDNADSYLYNLTYVQREASDVSGWYNREVEITLTNVPQTVANLFYVNIALLTTENYDMSITNTYVSFANDIERIYPVIPLTINQLANTRFMELR
jgi:UDP-3-O-[3-hydroxymyristoyl] glucosamine N-acyltransferase/cytoskeletal protein CcmA (bactofilin family)